MPHLPVGGAFLKLDAELLEALAGLLDVVDGDGDVAEAAARVGVAGGVTLEGGVGLSTVVVGELEDTLASEASCGVGHFAAVVEYEEVKREGVKDFF